jgi:aminomethyltransferase
MTSTDPRQPVRRSPLEHVHAGLGAEWVADDIRWPRGYGDAAAEQVAASERAGIADVGPIDILVVRGDKTPAALAAIGISNTPRTVVSGDDGTEVWCLGEDEAIVLRAGSADPTAVNALAERLRTSGGAVTDQSSGMSVLRLVGPATPAILAEACAVDLSPEALAPGAVAQVPMVGIRVSVARSDHAEAPGMTLLVMRDQAEYLWDSLISLGAAHGILPIGAIEATTR